MKQTTRILLLFAVLFCILPGSLSARTIEIPYQYYRLANGLRVVIAPDTTAPLVTVGVYYNIGFRLEPKGRTGFAHLFEHMMFQGSGNLGKMEFIKLIQSRGGMLNGSTRFDFTNYFEIVPSNSVEAALWAEADRMKSLAITQENLKNQQGVVMNEVKNAVINQPYGGFPWIDMPMAANENWCNAHNFYGDLAELEAATLEDVKAFFKTFYAPNNACLVVSGDIRTEDAKAIIQKYFAAIPAVEQPAPIDMSEPRQQTGKRVEKADKNARKPALAFGYKMPDRNTPEYYAMGLLDQILLQGDDSRLSRAFVQERGITSAMNGGINLLGNMFNYQGPMLWIGNFIYDANQSPDTLLAILDSEIAKLTEKPIDQKTIDRALIKMKADFYKTLSSVNGFGKADLLASFALFDNDPGKINRIEQEFAKITPEILRKTAQEYLRNTNRTVIVVKPAMPEKKEK